MSKKKQIFIYAGVIIISVAAFCILTGKLIRDTRQQQEAYDTALELISAEDYDGALELLKTISDTSYYDTYDLIRLCEAVNYLESGDYRDADFRIAGVSFSYLSDDLATQLDDVIEKIENEYSAYLRRKSAAENAAYDTQVRTGVPFVGMSESDIAKTSLGAPSSNVRHNTEMISGQAYSATIYDFYDSDTRIFTARCVQGEVIQVWDYRDDLTEDGDTTTSSSKKSSGTTNSDNDPYNADSYSHAGDFYYDHYDDFYDYEEAEAYWEAHN